MISKNLHNRLSAHSQGRTMRRRGFTLVEMTVVVSLASIVLGGVAVLLQGIWRAERSVANHRTNMAAMFRIGELFRDDVHAGKFTDAALPPNGPPVDEIAFVLPGDRTVEYSSSDAQIERIVRVKEEVVHQDTFSLPAGSTAGWHLADQEPYRVTLLITIPQGAKQLDPADKRIIRIDATMGPRALPIARAK
jgi:prepilin-type N-terminal cleavage/methylation domain-containing protein